MNKTRLAVALPIISAFTMIGLAQTDVKALYLDKCSICHGADGMGKTAKGKKLKVKDVHETLGKMPEAEMIKVVAEGKGKDMDGFGKELKQEQITALVAYYRGLGK
ncbi:MAG: cytochrome c [Terriglobia bacterium]